ncbi:hypothetical protein C8J57DRAFT_1281239 [Mycena rebaudengoi]|nr:hypothetical protein C8J57DRAFT_1281239 [Mycena rebaudengoi]
MLAIAFLLQTLIIRRQLQTNYTEACLQQTNHSETLPGLWAVRALHSTATPPIQSPCAWNEFHTLCWATPNRVFIH